MALRQADGSGDIVKIVFLVHQFQGGGIRALDTEPDLVQPDQAKLIEDPFRPDEILRPGLRSDPEVRQLPLYHHVADLLDPADVGEKIRIPDLDPFLDGVAVQFGELVDDALGASSPPLLVNLVVGAE